MACLSSRLITEVGNSLYIALVSPMMHCVRLGNGGKAPPNLPVHAYVCRALSAADGAGTVPSLSPLVGSDGVCGLK